ncbi:Biopolymer transport protein ExbD/TolR [Candidatus Zixiibacteriota bacterium]|nr:Biopolymer transport protein ExbD/TolR [candidate division Zixibacteria bacterium]
MAGEVVERQKAGKGKGHRRPKRRIAIRIDMTPMVDIAFLLLIFYMVSTVFSMPQAMEINLPPKEQEDQVEVAESNLLTLRIDGENHFFWNIGNPAKNLPQMIPAKAGTTGGKYIVNDDSLRMVLKNLNFENPKLNTLILIRKDARYNSMVDILDEIDLLERSWNAEKAKQLGKKADQLTPEEKFSYRYAIGDWEDSDDRIVEAALQARGGAN